MFCNKRVREAVGVPCLHINSSLRFNLQEVMIWARHRSAELNGQGIELSADTNEHIRTLQQQMSKLPT